MPTGAGTYRIVDVGRFAGAGPGRQAARIGPRFPSRAAAIKWLRDRGVTSAGKGTTGESGFRIEKVSGTKPRTRKIKGPRLTRR